MRISAVYALPFHRWVLGDLVDALRVRGHDIAEVEHVPDGPADWLTTGARGRRLLAASFGSGPPVDLVLSAETPYGPLRDAAGGAPVLSTRHSLAARGNTWEIDQGDADYLVSFGLWDRDLAATRRVVPRVGWIDTGCPWADRLLFGNRAEARSRLCAEHRLDSGRPIVAWAPTWNAWVPWREVLAWLTTLDAQVVVRPHWSSFWRDPDRMRALRDAGLAIDDPLDHPADLLLGSDVLVGDVSGIVLLATAMPGAELPIVQVRPLPSSSTSPQIDPDGPESRLRTSLGPVVDPTPEALQRALDLVMDDDPWWARRRHTRTYLFGDSDPEAGVRRVDRLVERIERIGGRS